MPAGDALAVIYSLMIDEVPNFETARYKIREKMDEALNRPFDPGEARAYDIALWAKQNEAVAAEQGWDLDTDFSQAP
jgi:hypothetical protein